MTESNVIYVDFSPKNNLEMPTENYLHEVKSVLCDDDYADFIEGLYNVSLYDKLDDDMKDLIDGYFRVKIV